MEVICTGIVSKYGFKFISVGYYCDSEGLPTPTGLCQRGYYCPEGQVVATPATYICPMGHFCLEGSAVEEPCASGTYQVRAYRVCKIQKHK